MQPPYLFDRYEPDQGDGIAASLDVESSVVTLAVHGFWTLSLRRDVHAAVHKCLSEHPAALILDLRAMRDPRGASVTTWTTARHWGETMDPPVQVLVCASSDSVVAGRLHRIGAARSMPIVTTMARARAAAAQWLPLTGRLQVRLAPELSAAAVSRAVVSDACTAWRLPDLRDRGRLVVSELVSNAVEHAATPLSVMLSRRGQGLHIAVRDGNASLPRIRPPNGRGLGLHAVHAAATSWGSIPSGTGKVVWATVWSWRRLQRHH